MKRSFLFFISIFSIFSACYADATLMMIPQISQDEMHNETGLELDQKTTAKYQAAAKFLALSASNSSKSKVQETNIINYETTSNGVHCHIGWYSDGYIATALDGTEQGKQIVVVNGAVVGISYYVTGYNDYFEHQYTWGKVYSYPYKQIVKFY